MKNEVLYYLVQYVIIDDKHGLIMNTETFKKDESAVTKRYEELLAENPHRNACLCCVYKYGWGITTLRKSWEEEDQKS